VSAIGSTEPQRNASCHASTKPWMVFVTL
jgi:hypothetical protein